MNSFPLVREKNVSLVIGSAFNAGFVSGSPRYNCGKDSFKSPADVIAKRNKFQQFADQFAVDLRTAALQFSAAPDVAVALVVGCWSPQQISENFNSLQAKIHFEFWAELRRHGLIEKNATLPFAPT